MPLVELEPRPKFLGPWWLRGKQWVRAYRDPDTNVVLYKEGPKVKSNVRR